MKTRKNTLSKNDVEKDFEDHNARETREGRPRERRSSRGGSSDNRPRRDSRSDGKRFESKKPSAPKKEYFQNFHDDNKKKTREDFKAKPEDGSPKKRRNTMDGSVVDDRDSRRDDDRKSYGDRDRKPRRDNDRGDRKPYGNRDRKPYDNDRKPRGDSEGGGRDRKPYGERRSYDGDRKPRRDSGDSGRDRKPYGERKSYDGDRKPRRDSEGGDRDRKPYGERKSYDGDRKPRRDSEGGDRERKSYGDRKPYDGDRTPRRQSGSEQRKSFGDRERRPYDGDRKPRRDFEQKDSEPRRREFNRRPPEKELVDEKMPLNKFISRAGVCSRREAAALIKAGEVTVNGEVNKEPGYKVVEGDVVKHQGNDMEKQEKTVYFLLNKAKDYITTTDDPEGRKTVMDLFTDVEERIFPVGRLDRNTTGLLLLTNDGHLAQQLSHPKFKSKKIYQVKLDKKLSDDDFDKIVAGIELEDGVAPVDSLAFINPENKSEIGIEIHIGKNRIVRRIFESLGYEVKSLDRVLYAGLTKKNLPRGKWRALDEKEIIFLKHFK